uniref:glutathione transferase n=1 Tax=Antheraea pernyi TaxID=7119 RepID=D3JYQ6_ANTPE|nr:glutathione S-transferase sigma [Antheraea pernyi]
MPKVATYYFPIKALGEGQRMLLAYGGQEFEDKRIPMEEWPEFKPKTLFGQMPVLEIDGKQYAQSTAICRYLGRKYGLNGADLEEDFEIDQNVEFFNDIRSNAAAYHYEKDEAVKARKLAEFRELKYTFLIEKLNEILEKNNGHIALGKLTWGDFVFAGLYDYLKLMLQEPNLDEKYPIFKKTVEAVTSLPKVKAYIDAAPKCDF